MDFCDINACEEGLVRLDRDLITLKGLVLIILFRRKTQKRLPSYQNIRNPNDSMTTNIFWI